MRSLPLLRLVLSFGAATALAALFAMPLVAQTGTVSGTVREAGSGRVIVGAQVFVAGGVARACVGERCVARIVATSDEDGRFTLANIPAGDVTIRVRFVGFTTQAAQQTIRGGASVEVNFELSRSVIRLDEVVVTGAGGQVEKKQLGNTIETINLREIQNAPVSTFSEALAARNPSVVALPSSGLAGSGARIRIRGTNSLSMSNEPIVYLDGIRIDNGGGFDGGVPTEAGGVSRLDDISPESIERIEILKGSAAATLYGSEAASGVIQIFTKRGSSGAPRFNFHIEGGLSTYPDVYKPNAGFARDAAQAATINELYQLNVQPFEVFERTFVDDMLETGNQWIGSGTVTGGGEAVQYFASGRYTWDDGPFGGSQLGPARDHNRKYQGNINLTIFPRERLTFRVSGMFADTRHDTPENGNNIFGVVSLAMFGKPELASCDDVDLDGSQDIDRSQMVGATTPVCSVSGNPTGQIAFSTVRESMQQVLRQDSEHFNGSITASYAATADLDFEVTAGLDATNGRSFSFAPFGYDLDNFTGNNVDGFRNIGARNHRELSLDIKSRWSTRLSDFSSNLTVGGQGFISQDETSGGFGSQFPGPGLEVAGAAANQSLREQSLEIVNAGVFAQWQVGYQDFAYVTVGGRFDRNSAFGENESGEFYPKLSGSFILSDMPSWNSGLISTLRFRGAIGKSGLQPGAFDKFTTFGPGPTFEGPGLEPDNLGNPDLAPERSTEWEVGSEVGLFQNRVGLDFTYWKRVTKDALIARQFPVTGGFTQTQLDNIGELKGEGLEIKVDWLAMDKENVSLSFNANASFLDELIRSMGSAPPIKVGGSYPRYRNFLKEGFAPGTYFGAQLIDFTPGQNVPFDTNGDGNPDTEAEFRAFLTGTAEIELGSSEMGPLIRDDDGDGDLLDHLLGKPTPDWQGAFGFNLTLWRNLQINNLFEFKAGDYSVTNLTDAFRKSNPSIGRNVKAAAEVEATLLDPSTQSNEQARFDAAMQWATELKALAPFSGLNTIENAKFIRWRELSVTYNMPSSFASKFGFDNMSLSFTGRNLVKWDGYSGIDQEMNALSRCGGAGQASRDCNFLDGVDAFGLPLPRRYALSLRFGF